MAFQLQVVLLFHILCICFGICTLICIFLVSLDQDMVVGFGYFSITCIYNLSFFRSYLIALFFYCEKLQLKNTELEEERKRNHVDLSAIDTQMKSEYEKRYSVKTNFKQKQPNASKYRYTMRPYQPLNCPPKKWIREQIPAILTQRLKSELTKLRRMYEEETEKAKQEFMYLHSSKVMQSWFWIKNIKAGHWIEWIDDHFIGLVI